jgi:acetyl esterase/lipase
MPLALPYGCKTSGDVTRCLDTYFATVRTQTGWRKLYMNIYLPSNRPGLDPLLIYIPGGGYVVGGREDCPGEIAAISGYAIACIEYRHSQEAVFPAQIYDVKRAVRWLRAHAAYYGIDPEKFGAWGDSAGGHLAALLGTSGDVKELEGPYGYISTSSKVQAVVDWFGLTDFTQVEPAFVEAISWPVPYEVWATYNEKPWYLYTVVTTLVLGGPVSQHLDLARQASPLTWVDPTDPPFLIVHGEADTIVPVQQSQFLSDWLGANAVPVTLVRDSWRGHSPSDQGGENWYGAATIEQALAFFDRYLHGRQ